MSTKKLLFKIQQLLTLQEDLVSESRLNRLNTKVQGRKMAARAGGSKVQKFQECEYHYMDLCDK